MSQPVHEPPPPFDKPSPERTARSRFPRGLLFVLLALGLVIWLARRGSTDADQQVSYSQFYTWLEDGKVSELTMRGQRLEGTLTEPQPTDGASIDHFVTTAPVDDRSLVPTLRQKGVTLRVSAEDGSWLLKLFITLLPWLLIIGVWMWLSKRAQMMTGSGGPLASFLKSKSRLFEKSTAVSVTFDDVAGLESAKRDLREIVMFLQKPGRFRKLGGKIPRGVLLVGPPGTGKTLLARAVAGESGVPFFRISASEFIEMFVGVGAARVRDLFEEAKRSAPAIVFIDEIDAVGRSRGAGLGGGHDEREQTLNQLLSAMDGFDRNDMVIVLAATNRPDVLDPALLRPGRFDRRVMVTRPEVDARRAILEVHTRGKPLDDDVDLDAVAATTPGFSGADLANLVNEAALGATRRGVDEIAQRDFLAAYDKIVLGDPREGKLDELERRRIAVHESGHAITAHFSPETEPLHRITIIPRGISLGATQQTPEHDRHLMTRVQLESRLRVLMGGYAAEEMVFGEGSTGAEQDLREATKLAAKMVAHYGMSAALGPVYVEHDVEHPFLGQRIATETGTSDATIHAIETESRALLKRASEEAVAVLEQHRAKLDQLVAVLLEHETIEKRELLDMLNGPEPADAPLSWLTPSPTPTH